MFADGIEKTVYRKLSEEDSVEDISTRLPNRRNRRDTICQCIPWVLLAIVSILYASHWYLRLRHDEKSPCFDEKLLGAPIIWEEKTYMSNLDGDIEDIYSMQNPNVEDAWKAVGFQHVTAITAEEMAHLPGHRQTAKLYGGQEGGAVLLEVFHQIHCLTAIRKGYFGNGTDEGGFGGPDEHADHCFSYLLQMLLCHADVGVMTTRWIESNQDFAANFDVTRQCRNFDAIREWAIGRRALHDTPGEVERTHG